MSIVKMKRIRFIGFLSDRDDLLQQMLLAGCVEVSEFPEGAEDKNLAGLISKQETELAALKQQHAKLLSALQVLKKHAPEKTGLFPVREEISMDTLFSPQLMAPALKIADELCTLEGQITRQYAGASQLESAKASLELWESLDVPLDIQDTQYTSILFGTVPKDADMDELEQNLYSAAVQSQLFRVGAGKEQQCFMLVCHKSMLENAVGVLRSYGFNRVSFDQSGTAAANVREISAKLRGSGTEIEKLKAEVAQYRDRKKDLLLCIDRLAMEISKEEAKENLVVSGSVFAMEGWVSAPEEEALRKAMEPFACAYELSDPEPDETAKVPVKLKNNKLTYPLNMVTEMYSLPVYDGIDPNGLITPFFTIFFGIMYADLGYGILLMLIALIAKKKWKPRGTMGQMMGLLLMVGVTTTVFGVLFGGFFGDVIPTISETFFGERIDLWRLIDPMKNPMVIMIGALVLGAIQILVGMTVSAYMSIRDGRPLDALFDVGSWWLVFAGIAVWVLGYGYWVVLAGVAALLLTQGRNSPTIPGKIMGGIASLYDITSYLSDILSYIRLMALLLATSVIASVVNLLGTMTGNLIGFFVVFLIGHVFNMGINIIGTYVHSARLQYLEFFGKFYKEGGRSFRPLKVYTKYHDVIDN